MSIRKYLYIGVSWLVCISCFHAKESPSAPDNIACKVIGITDGDTFDILMENKPVRIRMDAIDAPETGMPYSKVAKSYLSELCFGKFVTLQTGKTDRHDRLIARAFLEDGRDLSAEMIKAGMAWHYKAYSKDTRLAELENEARKNKTGLWADKVPVAPWEVRAYRRAGNRVEFRQDTFFVIKNK